MQHKWRMADFMRRCKGEMMVASMTIQISAGCSKAFICSDWISDTATPTSGKARPRSLASW
ncbi:hypothetical protein AOD73_05915 [Pseudomonas aeruginosa]|nr:hypothetical protein PA1S_05920 [Pseudomonas aeruginosa PA1]ALE46990.1 hypothetical protein AOD73_05915 [Pseudomonas aeruginosa]